MISLKLRPKSRRASPELLIFKPLLLSKTIVTPLNLNGKPILASSKRRFYYAINTLQIAQELDIYPKITIK